MKEERIRELELSIRNLKRIIIEKKNMLEEREKELKQQLSKEVQGK